MNKSLKLLIAQSSPINSEKITALKTEYNKMRNLHRKLTREDKAKKSVGRDKLLFSDPAAVQRSIKSSRRNKAGKIQKLTVGNNTYVGDSVQDGFFHSISKLKFIHLLQFDHFNKITYIINLKVFKL